MTRGRPSQDITLIERDIAQTRVRLSRDLAMLDREYAMRNLFVHALRFAGKGKNTPALVASAKHNALPLGLVGIGLAWLTVADPDRATGQRLRHALEQTWRLFESAIGGSAAPAAQSPADKLKEGDNL